MARLFGPPLPLPSASTYYISNGRKLRAEIFLPKTPRVGPLPIHINIHGCGFCLNTFGLDRKLSAYIANNVKCAVVSVDYSKAPEYPFPSAPDDIDACIHWVKRQSLERGWDSGRISVGGGSSGGCLALVAASGAAGRDLKAVVALYPA